MCVLHDSLPVLLYFQSSTAVLDIDDFAEMPELMMYIVS